MAAEAAVIQIRECCRHTAEAYEQQLMEAGEHIHGLELELRGKRSRIKKLEQELADARQTDPLRGHAEEVWEFWREQISPRARGFTGKRLANVLDRLKEAGKDEIEDRKAEIFEAILGAKFDPFTSPKGIKYDDLELICRDASKLDDFRKRWQAFEERQRQRNPPPVREDVKEARERFYEASRKTSEDEYLARCAWRNPKDPGCWGLGVGTLKQLLQEGWMPATGGWWECPDHAHYEVTS